MLIRLMDVQLIRETLYRKQEHHVVREHYDLASFGLFNEPPRNRFAPLVVER